MSRRLFAQLGRRLFVGLIFVLVAAPAAVAQTSTGSIRGYVTDSSGTPVAGAPVAALNIATSPQREVATQSNRVSALFRLLATQYDLSARPNGSAPQTLT